MTPGPVPVPPEVLEILAQPMIHHRTPEFQRVYKSVCQKLKQTFLTEQPVFLHTATGSGAMESALVNTLSPGDHVLAIVSGKFGERWAQMARAYGMTVTEINVPWGQAVQGYEVEKELDANPKIRAVLCQASETSTATQHPIQEIAAIVKKHPGAVFMVDAITAIGAMTLPMDEWGLDVVVSGSQKAFMLPTGISFITLSEKAWKLSAEATCPRFYFDLRLELEAYKKNDTHFSAPVSMIKALDRALDFLTGSELEKAVMRSQKMAAITRRACESMGLHIYSKSPSSAVTAIELPKDIDSQKVRDRMETHYNVTVMGGQDQLKGRILRIGHLGWIQNEDLEICIEAMGLALLDVAPESSLGLTKDKIQKAVQSLQQELQQKIAQ